MDATDIDLTGTNRLSRGETLDGKGATLKVKQHEDDDERDGAYPRPLISAPEGCTIKNITLLGAFTDIVRDEGWWDYEKSGEAWLTGSSAINITGSNVLVENVTCTGWSFGGVIVGSLGGAPHRNVFIRDCDLVDNNCRALGYGLAVYSGIPIVEWTDFQNNRHDIATGGRGNAGYEARFNYVGDIGRIYGFEAHGPHSARIHIHHNTFADKRGNYPPKGTDRRVLIRNRGVPVEPCLVEGNWFKGAMTVKMNAESSDMYEFRNNHEGSSPPPEGVGQPNRAAPDPEPDTPHTPGPGRPYRQSLKQRAALKGAIGAVEDIHNITSR